MFNFYILKFYNWFDVVTTLMIVDSSNFSKSIFRENFYNLDFFFNIELFLSILPECLVLYFILYSLINIFNAKKNSIIIYYRWIFIFVIIFILLLFNFIASFSFIHFNYSENTNTNLTILLSQNFSTKILFGYTWINCFYTLFSKLVIIILVLCVLIFSKFKIQNATSMSCSIELPLIIAFCVLFLFLLTSAYDFFVTYLAIEGLSLTLYSMAAILSQSIISVEASFKYFSLGAISSGILLFGISIIFGLIGCLDFLEIQLFLGGVYSTIYFFEIKISLILILFGFFFKISAFPCHVWVADVYEGIWTPITAFFAVVIKIGLLLFFVRLLFNLLFNVLFFFQQILIFVAVGSMLVGSFGAIKQVRIKRFIAYASITQVGFIFLGLSSCSLIGLIASILYIFLYGTTTLIFFGIILNTENIITRRSMIYLSDLSSFLINNGEWSNYLILSIFSMAGLPPLGGFIGKFFLYFAGISANLDFAIILSLIISVLSVYYYLSFARYIFFEKYRIIKLFFYKKNNLNNILIRILSSLLLFFVFYFVKVILFINSISVSCLWPLFWY